MSMAKEKKRADLVRERRKNRGRKKTAAGINRRKRTSLRTAAPTVVRLPSMAHAKGRRAKRSVLRKRKYLSLPTTGAEIRLPSVPSIHVGWRAASGVIALALIFAVYTLLTSATFQVGLIEVSGLERIGSQEVNSLLGVFGATIFSVEPQAIQTTLQASFPEMTDVKVRVGFPAKILIGASERQPLIIWEQGGKSSWLDENGISFAQRGQAEGLVRVQASAAPADLGDLEASQDQVISAQMVQAILALSQHSPQGTTILYDRGHGLGWVDPGGWQVFFGADPDDMDTRLVIYATMLAALEQRGIRPVMISVEFLHAPYYRLVAVE